jgi:hypothetical protein
MQQMYLPIVLICAAVPIALGGGHYAPVGGDAEVLVDEGYNLASFKEDCSAETDDTCFQTTPDLSMCEAMCDKHTACNSFAYCTGNVNASFTRCYLKTKKVDMTTVAHGEGTCSTYKHDGTILDSTGMVARSEGHNLASFKPDCTEEVVDFCFKVTPDQEMCKNACEKQDGCKSFAFCDGSGTVGFTRCYLKTADFDTKIHGAGDCKSFYHAELGHCSDVKDYYKSQGCCGMPSKELNPNKPMHF